MWRARSQDEGSDAMQIPFSAFAEDCTVSGELALPTDRLSDFLTSTDEYEVANPSFRALDDGRTVTAESSTIGRDDLFVVMATGPRGRPDRRLWTRHYPVRCRVGPYTVFGYLHAPPTIDPMRRTDRRPIVALTESTLEYTAGGEVMRIEAEAVLVNSAKIDRLEAANTQDPFLANDLALPSRLVARAKDLTGA